MLKCIIPYLPILYIINSLIIMYLMFFTESGRENYYSSFYNKKGKK